MSDQLKRQQVYGLWLSGRSPVETESDALRFMQAVKIALRYNPTPGLPLASMYAAAADKRRAVELTNALLVSQDIIETNLIAERLVLAHRSIGSALYTLRKRHRPATVSVNAERAFALIVNEGHASAGDIRRFMGITGQKRPDAADVALTELQRELLVDRGPASIPEKGIPYLSPEGYPYRPFEKAHPDMVRTAGKLSIERAVCVVVEAYLEAAVFITPRKLASMFKLLFSEGELNSMSSKNIDKQKNCWLWLRRSE